MKERIHNYARSKWNSLNRLEIYRDIFHPIAFKSDCRQITLFYKRGTRDEHKKILVKNVLNSFDRSMWDNIKAIWYWSNGDTCKAMAKDPPPKMTRKYGEIRTNQWNEWTNEWAYERVKMSMARFYGINRYFHMRVQNPPHIQNKTFHTWSAWKFTFGTVIASSYMFACCSIFSSVQLRLILRLNLVTFRKNAEYECGSLSPMLFLSHHRQPFYCNDKIIRYSIRFGMKKCSQTTAFRSFHSFTCANISKKTSIKQPIPRTPHVYMWLFKRIASKTVHDCSYRIRLPFYSKIAYTPILHLRIFLLPAMKMRNKHSDQKHTHTRIPMRGRHKSKYTLRSMDPEIKLIPIHNRNEMKW